MALNEIRWGLGPGQADCAQCSEVPAWRCGWGLHSFARSS